MSDVSVPSYEPIDLGGYKLAHRAMHTEKPCAACEIVSLRQQLSQAQQELADWRTWGIIEVAIRNPNVSSYMDHWEKRAELAESRLSALTQEARYMRHEPLEAADKMGTWGETDEDKAKCREMLRAYAQTLPEWPGQ